MPQEFISVHRSDLLLLINAAIHMRTELAREQGLTLFPFLRTLASERIAELTATIETIDQALHPQRPETEHLAVDGFHGIRISASNS